MLNQCLKNTGEGLLHACISSTLSELTPSNEELFTPFLHPPLFRYGISKEKLYTESRIYMEQILYIISNILFYYIIVLHSQTNPRMSLKTWTQLVTDETKSWTSSIWVHPLYTPGQIFIRNVSDVAA